MASSYIKVLSLYIGLSNVYEVHMAKLNKKNRISKAEWLEAAMSVLETEGINAVKIERLAKVLKTSRSGFYWHFQDRSALAERDFGLLAHGIYRDSHQEGTTRGGAPEKTLVPDYAND